MTKPRPNAHFITVLNKNCIEKANGKPFVFSNQLWRTNYWIYINNFLAQRDARQYLTQAVPGQWRKGLMCTMERDFATLLAISSYDNTPFAFPDGSNPCARPDNYHVIVGGKYGEGKITAGQSTVIITSVGASGATVKQLLRECQRLYIKPRGVICVVDCCPAHQIRNICRDAGIPYKAIVTAAELGIEPAIAPPVYVSNSKPATSILTPLVETPPTKASVCDEKGSQCQKSTSG